MDESQTIRVSIEEAATLLGIEKGSVKKRIQRDKLRSEKDARGVTWVYVDRSETVRDSRRDGPRQIGMNSSESYATGCVSLKTSFSRPTSATARTGACWLLRWSGCRRS